MSLDPGYVSSLGVVDTGGNQRKLSALFTETFTNPATADADGLLLAAAGPDTTTATYRADDDTLDGALNVASVVLFAHPRNVVIVVDHASAVVALSGVITGTDLHGDTLTEAWSVTAGTTQKTFTGSKAFKTITQITVIAAADASLDTVTIGTGVVFGLSVKCSVASAVKEYSEGSLVTNGVIVAGSSLAAADARGTYAPNAAPDGAKDYVVTYITEHPEQS